MMNDEQFFQKKYDRGMRWSFFMSFKHWQKKTSLACLLVEV